MKKLKNERGESILMALLLLLLASVISALILTAATNAAHHLRNDRKAQQNYLTVSSAAELIRDSILQESYTRVWEKVTTYKMDDKGQYVWQKEDTKLVPGQFTGIMKAWLAAGIAYNENKDAKYASVTGYQDTIKVDVPIGGEDGLQTVQAEFTMDKDTANITVKLSLLPPDGQGSTGTERSAAEDCRMTLTMKGAVSKKDESPAGGSISEENGTKIEKYTTTINWSGAKITKGIKEANSEQAEG